MCLGRQVCFITSIGDRPLGSPSSCRSLPSLTTGYPSCDADTRNLESNQHDTCWLDHQEPRSIPRCFFQPTPILSKLQATPLSLKKTLCMIMLMRLPSPASRTDRHVFDGAGVPSETGGVEHLTPLERGRQFCHRALLCCTLLHCRTGAEVLFAPEIAETSTEESLCLFQLLKMS